MPPSAGFEAQGRMPAMSLKSMTRKKARRLLGISLFLLSLRCIAQSSASSEHEIESHSRRAQTFLRENRPDLAISSQCPAYERQPQVSNCERTRHALPADQAICSGSFAIAEETQTLAAVTRFRGPIFFGFYWRPVLKSSPRSGRVSCKKYERVDMTLSRERRLH